ncbi:MAG: arginine deiminase [Sphaerochaetaceae bacterium]|jgi:arginine deiminase
MQSISYDFPGGPNLLSVNVSSEISQLKKVLLHRPGQELENLTPNYLERLLFDDIPFLPIAQKEHDAFAKALQDHGVETVYLEDLMTEVIGHNDDLRRQFIEDFIYEGGSSAIGNISELSELLLSIKDPKELVLKTMAGVVDTELQREDGKNPLADMIQPKVRFVLDPIPNLYFTRDAFAIIGHGVTLNRMYSVTRARETIYGRYIFNYHPDFKDKVRQYYTPDIPFCIEGGDVMNISDRILAVGLSQRTSPEAVEILSNNVFDDPESQIDTVLAIDIPDMRAYMHLDTVLTQVNEAAFLVHPGILDYFSIYKIKRGTKGNLKVEYQEDDLETVLSSVIGQKITLITTGGDDAIAAEREQWNDGSNCLCVSPGEVVVYDRNVITNSVLNEHGIKTIEIPSSELSRGRGGPRCMSMPLERA